MTRLTRRALIAGGVAAAGGALGAALGAAGRRFGLIPPDAGGIYDEALHPQTLLAWGMNGSALPVPFGGPLRLRVPRQLGYKSVKFLNRITVTDTLDGFGDGSGQSAVNAGYAWYAGI